MESSNCNCPDSSITEDVYGDMWAAPAGQTIDEPLPKPIKSYTLRNCNRMEVVIITLGATIVSIKCPDKYGRPSDVALGFDNLKAYLNFRHNPFIGCILGRCANRIKDGYFTIKGKGYQLSQNDLGKQHHLHGGKNGLGRRVWESYVADCSVIMTYLSQDGEEGYPGALLTTIRFRLTTDNKLDISMRATTSKPTIVNLSHGSIFNLAGHDTGEEELRKHKILLNCDRWTYTDFMDPIPSGVIESVAGTIMDMRIPKDLGQCLDKIPEAMGYDHNLCVTRNWQAGTLFVAKVWHPKSGRVLEVYSDQPGVQVYTGGRLMSEMDLESVPSDSTSYEVEDMGFGEPKLDDSFTVCADGDIEKFQNEFKVEPCTKNGEEEDAYILGKNGAKYRKNCAFSIQPQNYPNAINNKHFPCPILHPGQVYCHDLTYKFGLHLTEYT